MTSEVVRDDSEEFRLAGLRSAIQIAAAEARPAHEFRVASAWQASVRFNLAGWLGRLVLLGAVLAVHAPAGRSWLIAWVVAVAGWVLAGVDLFGEHLANRWRTGLLGRLATHLQSGRGVATWNLPAVLENLGATLLLAAFAQSGVSEIGTTATMIGLLLVSGLGAVMVAQIVTDAGYYNADPTKKPRWYAIPARWALIPTYAAAAIAACLSAGLSGNATNWACGTCALVFSAVVIVAIAVHNAHAASMAAWAVSSERQMSEFLGVVSRATHVFGARLEALAEELDEAEADGDLPADFAVRKLRETFAQLDVLTAQARGRDLTAPLPLGQLVALLGRKHFGSGVLVKHGSDAEMVLGAGGANALAQVILDLVANATAAGSASTTVEVDVAPLAHPTVRMSVTVTDTGRGFQGADPAPKPGSSRDAIRRLCERRRGTFSYTFNDGLTVARATFEADLWEPVREDV